MDAKKLIQDAQALITPHQLDEFFAYLADDETIRSVRCDLLAETALIEVRALDPIVALFDYEGCLFHWESPFGELKPQFGEFGSPQRRALAKIAQLHAREKVRAEHGLPPLSEFERERWLVRPPRPFLPTDPPRYTFPMPHPPQVCKAPLQHPDELLRKIADMVRRTYPEEVAYWLAARSEREIGQGFWGVGWLTSIDSRIRNVERYLAPPKGPDDWWLQSHDVKKILAAGDPEENESGSSSIIGSLLSLLGWGTPARDR